MSGQIDRPGWNSPFVVRCTRNTNAHDYSAAPPLMRSLAGNSPTKGHRHLPVGNKPNRICIYIYIYVSIYIYIYKYTI